MPREWHERGAKGAYTTKSPENQATLNTQKNVYTLVAGAVCCRLFSGSLATPKSYQNYGLTENTYHTNTHTHTLLSNHLSTPSPQQYSLLQNVVETCQKKNHCKFVAAPGRHGEGDPCPDKQKFVEVAYKCRPCKCIAVYSHASSYIYVTCMPHIHTKYRYALTLSRLSYLGQPISGTAKTKRCRTKFSDVFPLPPPFGACVFVRMGSRNLEYVLPMCGGINSAIVCPRKSIEYSISTGVLFKRIFLRARALLCLLFSFTKTHEYICRV